MGRNKFSAREIVKIRQLLRVKNAGNRYQQKLVRHQLRVDYEFNISDFNVPGKAFGEEELIQALDRGAIQILDDATIADMVAKRARDREKDMALKEETDIKTGEVTDWREALKEWEEWQSQNAENPEEK